MRLALTGTSAENTLTDLWALFDWLVPGLLGDRKAFRAGVVWPVEKEGNAKAQARLNCHMQLFVLRRTKDQVALDLPAKTEITERIPRGPKQQALCETDRTAMNAQVREGRCLSDRAADRQGQAAIGQGDLALGLGQDFWLRTASMFSINDRSSRAKRPAQDLSHGFQAAQPIDLPVSAHEDTADTAASATAGLRRCRKRSIMRLKRLGSAGLSTKSMAAGISSESIPRDARIIGNRSQSGKVAVGPMRTASPAEWTNTA